MGDFFVGISNKFISGIGASISWVISKLPQSPFAQITSGPAQEYMGYINWIVPVGQILTILGAWCGCIALYYVAQIALRWLKVVE